MRAATVQGRAASAATTPLGSEMENYVKGGGAMITQTPEYVITANNRRIVYVNTFICLSLTR
jgi:hypothetical protein